MEHTAKKKYGSIDKEDLAQVQPAAHRRGV